MTETIKLRNITKTFGKTIANSNVSLDIRKGEILALLGENGSGKSTLMNILSGIYYPDSGSIFIDGVKKTFSSPKDALNEGIGMIHQHFKLIDVFTASENIILGLKGKFFINKKQVENKVEEIANRYSFNIDPKKKIYEMSVSEKQTVEIMKVLYRGVDTMILDEPTAVLTPQETERLFTVLRKMRADGKAIIIITHKLNEVLAISDRVGILRKGELVEVLNTKDADSEKLTDLMVGEHVELKIDRSEPSYKDRVLEIRHLNVYGDDGNKALDNISFECYGGEILGIAGVSGSGQKPLLEAIAGLQKAALHSHINYFDSEQKKVHLVGKNPKAIRKLGVGLAFVPEDRLGMGLVGDMGMTENMMLRSYENGFSPFVEEKEPSRLAKNVMKDLNVVAPDTKTPVRKLSGGNVQKVLVGREIAMSPRLLLTAYAVRGLDINTSYAIYNILDQQKKKGTAVIYVGEDLDVLLALTDRILVLCDGKMSGIVDSRKTTKIEVGRMMAGERKVQA